MKEFENKRIIKKRLYSKFTAIILLVILFLLVKGTFNIYQKASESKAQLDLAKAKLELKKTPARDFEIAEAEADLRSAQATLNRYLSDLAETVIRAPVAGLITDINFDKGEQTSLSEPIISMIGLSKMQIEVDVPESDITKIEIGDQVDITLDAFLFCKGR